MAHVQMTHKESIVDQVEEMEEQIARRAYDLFLERGAPWGDRWADWFAAEREVVRRPAVNLREQDGVYTVSASLAGFDPQDIRVDITPDDMVITADAARPATAGHGHLHMAELAGERVFRLVHFPRPVDISKARGEYRNGLLIVSAPLAEAVRAPRPVKVA